MGRKPLPPDLKRRNLNVTVSPILDDYVEEQSKLRRADRSAIVSWALQVVRRLEQTLGARYWADVYDPVGDALGIRLAQAMQVELDRLARIEPTGLSLGAPTSAPGVRARRHRG